MLFSVTVANSAANQLPAAVRASDIEATLGQITGDADGDGRPEYDPRTLRISMRRQGVNEVLEASDDHHHAPLNIATVTAADASEQAQSADALAADWQERLQGALVTSLAIREPRLQRTATSSRWRSRLPRC